VTPSKRDDGVVSDPIEKGRRIFESGKYAPKAPAADRNGHDPDDDMFSDGTPLPDEPPEFDGHAGEWSQTTTNGHRPHNDAEDQAEKGDNTAEQVAKPTTWEPVDLGPYLRGEVEPPRPPNIGIHRSDDIQLCYSGREHAVVGETESAKTWLALGSVAAELGAGHHVVYIHYEEAGPESTIERLRLLGVPDKLLLPPLFRFIAPQKAAHKEWIAALLAPTPTLVVHDGVNEAMSLHASDVMKVDGVSEFRRRLIFPFLRVGAATLACDHMPMGSDGGRRDAYGSVHKGNALDGARILLENREPFGRKLRGRSHVFVTKDRPGHLRAHGRPTKTPGKTYIGTLIGDDSDPFKPFSLAFYAPKAEDSTDHPENNPAAELADTVWEVLAALPGRTADSQRALFAQMRKAGHQFTEAKALDAIEDLIADDRVREVKGKRGAKGYQAVTTAAEAGQQ
jgi:hypothetical protein